MHNPALHCHENCEDIVAEIPGTDNADGAALTERRDEGITKRGILFA